MIDDMNKLHQALVVLFVVVVNELRLPQFVDWLSRKLTRG